MECADGCDLNARTRSHGKPRGNEAVVQTDVLQFAASLLDEFAAVDQEEHPLSATTASPATFAPKTVLPPPVGSGTTMRCRPLRISALILSRTAH